MNGIVKFPSPHGDKFQHTEMMSEYTKPEFPSPHGDKFQLNGMAKEIIAIQFPPPHGDKFQRLGKFYAPRYRAVSVPSRG